MQIGDAQLGCSRLVGRLFATQAESHHRRHEFQGLMKVAIVVLI